MAACGRTVAMLFTLASFQFALAQTPPKNFVLHDLPKPVAAISFEDDQGRPRSLANFNGKIVILNIWATWCGPCRAEMPALDRLQVALGGRDFEVAPVSIDRAGNEVGRITGPAEWDAPELAEFLKPIIARQNDAAETVGRDAKSPAADKNSSGPLTRGFQWMKTLFIR